MIKAKYTMTFMSWLYKIKAPLVSTYKEVLKQYVRNSGYNHIDEDKLVDMLESVYEFYETGTNDDNEMLFFMVDTFKEYGSYYNELIENYEKEYNYALNNKRVITKRDELNMEGNTNISNEASGSTTRYDLPNKVVPESNWRSTPSDITDTIDNSTNDKNYTNETTRDSVTTTEFNNELIDLKNKYINQIRNVYREFAMKFKDCFYQVY